jgi:hypothetical protein
LVLTTREDFAEPLVRVLAATRAAAAEAVMADMTIAKSLLRLQAIE